ncbi:MAG: thioredoxin [Micromonosporaceae bacterium]|nr:thioredoxin [Micromonosporaceae bacterium]
MNVTDATFAEQVLSSEEPVLVDFWAQWCPPCHRLAPVLDRLAEEYAGRARVVKMDADQNPATIRAYRVMAMPTLTVFRRGAVVAQVVGAVPLPRLRAMLDSALAAGQAPV